MNRPGPAATACLVAVLALGGCVSEEHAEGPERMAISSLDDAFTLQVPADWTHRSGLERRSIVLAASGPGDRELRVAHYPQGQLVEQQALNQAEVLARRGILCERLDASDAFGDPRLVFDCPDEAAGERQILVPFEHDGSGWLMLLKVPGATFEDAVASARPIVTSVVWAH